MTVEEALKACRECDNRGMCDNMIPPGKRYDERDGRATYSKEFVRAWVRNLYVPPCISETSPQQ